MIGPDDIEAFQEAHQDAIDKGSEFARRAFKGLPADRFGSADDLFLVAQGIKARDSIIELQTRIITDMFNEMQKRGADAMRLYSQDSKYAK